MPLYGDKIAELRSLIDEDTKDDEFIVRLKGDILGAATRVLRGMNDYPPFLQYRGNEEHLTKDNFTAALKKVWPELF